MQHFYKLKLDVSGEAFVGNVNGMPTVVRYVDGQLMALLRNDARDIRIELNPPTEVNVLVSRLPAYTGSDGTLRFSYWEVDKYVAAGSYLSEAINVAIMKI